MRTFIKNSVPSLLLLATLTVGAYSLLSPPAAPAARPEAVEMAGHMLTCPVCRLAPFGHDGQASRFGPAPGSPREKRVISF